MGNVDNTKKTPAKRAGNRGLGRKKGSKNIVTKNIRGALEQALACDPKGDTPGEVVFFKKMKKEQPVAFLNVVAKLLPIQVDIDATIDNHITFKLIK